MTSEQIRELAEKDGKLTKSELEHKLISLKSLNCSILECVIYVKVNQSCSLMDAKILVINSAAWIDEKAQFICHQQEEMKEFLEAAKNDIESVEHIYTPHKMEINVRMKPKK